MFIFIYSDAPSTDPVLGGPGSLSVDEGEQVTLQCSLGDLGNPPIMWSWICGGKNLTGNATNSGKQSTLKFTADRQYNQRTCQCWATSQRLQYTRTSEKINITVFCRLFLTVRLILIIMYIPVIMVSEKR